MYTLVLLNTLLRENGDYHTLSTKLDYVYFLPL